MEAVHLSRTSTLWTKNFTIITLGTLVSAIGGTAMGVALSLVVFDNTQSAFFTALYSALSVLPGLTLPILLGPLLDRVSRKRVIVSLDALLGVLNLLFGALTFLRGFDYAAYLIFGVLSGLIGSVYSVAYSALYPDLIPEGFLQKGYSVSAMIYPMVTVIVSPLAALLYSTWGIHVLFFGEGALLLLASTFERQIRVEEKLLDRPHEPLNLRAYAADLAETFRYLRREKAVLYLYANMAVINGASYGLSLMVMAFFQTSPALTTVMYSLLLSAETLGRAAGGAVHYAVDIPKKARFPLTRAVYLLTSVLEGVLLFLPYVGMLAARFIAGFAGVNTATLREAAIQRHLPGSIRARINGLLDVSCQAGVMIFQLLAGALGDIFPYRSVALLFSALCIASICILIVPRRAVIEPLFTQDETKAGDAPDAPGA